MKFTYKTAMVVLNSDMAKKIIALSDAIDFAERRDWWIMNRIENPPKHYPATMNPNKKHLVLMLCVMCACPLKWVSSYIGAFYYKTPHYTINSCDHMKLIQSPYVICAIVELMYSDACRSSRARERAGKCCPTCLN